MIYHPLFYLFRNLKDTYLGELKRLNSQRWADILVLVSSLPFDAMNSGTISWKALGIQDSASAS